MNCQKLYVKRSFKVNIESMKKNPIYSIELIGLLVQYNYVV